MEKEYKRFMVFCYAAYCPAGGIDDVKNSFDEGSDAIAYAKERTDECVYIFDRRSGIVIWDKDRA